MAIKLLLNRCAKQNKEQLVLIGHPKAFTPFSLKELKPLLVKERMIVFLLHSKL